MYKAQKATGKAKKTKNVAVRVCRFFHCVFTFFNFFPRSVQQILLSGKSSHKCRSGTREKKKKQNTCNNKANCAVFAFSFAFVFSHFFAKRTLFDDWSCMAAIAQHNSGL